VAKKENLEFLASVYYTAVIKATQKSTIPLDDYDALLDWLFGTEERTIAACTRVAYGDVKRRFSGIGKMPEKDKQKWRGDVERLIEGHIGDLFKGVLSERGAFDVWHNKACEDICNVSDEHNIPQWVEWMDGEFTYGLAQKWLNMTIKNMLIMERWDEKLEPIKKCLHVPVDSYIMEAASEMLGVGIVDTQGQFKPYKEGVSKPWSKWDYSDYIKFQEDVRNAADCPIDWEYSAWNKTKAKRAGL
jgi:hypothetical protein